MAKMTGGKAVLESLKAHGVDTLFGIISVHNLDLYDALFDQRDSFRYIGGRMELGCGFMADGYSRVSGKPGVLITSTGPGAADSIGAMGEAYHSACPILQITTNVEREFINSRRGATHEPKNQVEMFQSVTDWTSLITEVDAIPDAVHEAFRRFRERRPRPIELEVATDVLGMESDVEIVPPLAARPPHGYEAEIARAANMLKAAKRPVIVVGEEVQYHGGTHEVIRLAEAMGAPVVTADGGKGAFPEDHPLSLGPALGGRIWGVNPVQELIAGCDTALVVGSVLPYRSTVGVGLKMPASLVHVLMDEEAIGRNYPATVAIAANPQQTVVQILEAVGSSGFQADDGYRKECQELKGRIDSGLAEQWPNEVRALEAIREALPRDAITVWDPTVPTSRATRAFAAYQPRTFIYPHGWVGLGYAFPAAMGAKAAKPDAPVICVTGDGGFQYNLQELATASQYGINPIVLMFNDNAWGVLKQYQQNNFSGRYIGTELVNPDFVKLFESYGFEGVKVDSLDQLTTELDSAVKADKLKLIEVQIPDGFAAFR